MPFGGHVTSREVNFIVEELNYKHVAVERGVSPKEIRIQVRLNVSERGRVSIPLGRRKSSLRECNRVNGGGLKRVNERNSESENGLKLGREYLAMESLKYH